MPPVSPGFLQGIKEACDADSHTPFVLIGNFEVEDEWAVGEPGLPTLSGRQSRAVVNRMDEFALLLAAKGDYVVLKSAPDPGYVSYLEELGLDLPGILTTDVHNPDRTVSADALDSPGLQDALRELGAAGARLWPHGMSELEERLCDLTGLTPALPPAALTKSVNSKIFSRRLADELGIPQARGWTCESVSEFAEAAEEVIASVLAAGGRVGVKDAYGVSGKGIVVIDSPDRLRQLVRMLTRTARRTGDPSLSLVIEEWADKAVDLNYHFTVARDAAVRFDFVKEAITDKGVHKGHRFPARIPPAHRAAIEEYAHLIGARLAAEGFHGVVGVDAIITAADELLPVLEINARNNMSTYQATLQEQFMAGRRQAVAIARQYDLTLRGHLSFERLRTDLGPLLLDRAEGTGLLVNNFATVNAAALRQEAGQPCQGRLYGLLICDDESELTALDQAITDRLREEYAHHV